MSLTDELLPWFQIGGTVFTAVAAVAAAISARATLRSVMSTSAALPWAVRVRTATPHGQRSWLLRSGKLRTSSPTVHSRCAVGPAASITDRCTSQLGAPQTTVCATPAADLAWSGQGCCATRVRNLCRTRNTNGASPQPDEACPRRLPVLGQARAGTRGQTGRPPPPPGPPGRTVEPAPTRAHRDPRHAQDHYSHRSPPDNRTIMHCGSR